MAWYKTGTVAVTNASTTVTGTGTNFVSGAQVGDGFLGPNELLYEITAINSATSLTIAPAYGGATASSQNYAIAPTQGLVASLASDVTDLITDYQSVVDNAGAGKFGDGSAASPAIRFTNDQDTGFFRDTANEIAFATAGVKRGEFTSSGIQLLDGQKFIAGTGSDLSIFHNGSASIIEDSGTGGLTIRSDIFTVQNAAGNETVAQFVQDGFVKLFHNNSQVFTTTSGGASITGSLGIGISSPNGLLELRAGDGSGTLNIVSTVNAANAGNKIAFFGANRSDTDEEMAYIKPLLVSNSGGSGNVQDGHLTFGTSGNEAMRIDSSGALMVGKATAGDTGAGVTVQGVGKISAVRDGGISAKFVRETSDGSIVEFVKDTTVGSIGTGSSRLAVGNGDTYITFAGDLDALYPASSSSTTPRDNAVNIGTSGTRFKDLYLSGGVYLGGTGSANKLDDYEEGTWTPFYHGGTTTPTCTYDIQAGYYTKVGRQVNCHGRIRTDAVSGGSGLLSIGGLPFTAMNVNGNGSGGTVTIGSRLSFKSGEFGPEIGYVTEQTTTALLRYFSGTNTAGNCEVAALDNTTNDNDIMFSISYITTQ